MIEKIKNTRSHRKFTDKKISKEEILKILEKCNKIITTKLKGDSQ